MRTAVGKVALRHLIEQGVALFHGELVVRFDGGFAGGLRQFRGVGAAGETAVFGHEGENVPEDASRIVLPQRLGDRVEFDRVIPEGLRFEPQRMENLPVRI